MPVRVEGEKRRHYRDKNPFGIAFDRYLTAIEITEIKAPLHRTFIFLMSLLCQLWQRERHSNFDLNQKCVIDDF